MTFESRANSGKIVATVQMPERRKPKRLLVRLRHPEEKSIRSATVNGADWRDFDPKKEWIRIENPDAAHYDIIARY